MYYPTAIADDESLESSCSNSDEGAQQQQPQHLKNKSYPWEKKDEYGLAEEEDFDDPALHRRDKLSDKPNATKSKEDVAALIEKERNRRLGVATTTAVTTTRTAASENLERIAENTPHNNSERSHSQSSGGLLGNIKGWFAGNHEASDRSLSNSARSLHEPETQTHRAHQNPRGSDTLNSTIEEESDDSSSGASSSSDDSSTNSSRHHSIDHRTRARHRALRYLSNSCVDAGRKSKTLSYIWGLERLDLKRRRDRYERELGVVESEMGKDWGSGDKVGELAERLVGELPRLMVGGRGADAGAGSGRGKRGYVMSLDEYVELVEQFDPVSECDENRPSNLLWSNKESMEKYSAYIQARLRETMERTKSLEKRLAVLEKTGDEIVASLCEDLVDVTSHSNKAEARYVKKGKELERKRRREELKFRGKIKELERRINLLEDGILTGTTEKSIDAESSDSDEEGDEDNDEVCLEKKLSDIKARSELEKAEHEQSAQSIRRQCEQSKLRLSVARLVMAGDDNLREYISVLEKLDPSKHQQLRWRSQFGKSGCDDEYGGMPTEVLPPPPPAKVTRGRAKLLKAMHLERIYEQRLAVSKAFNDAAINALEHELADREEAGEQMEVRCMNELMVIDSDIKEIVSSGEKKVAELEKEVRELEDAMEVSSNVIAKAKSREGADQLATVEYKPESTDSTDDDSTSDESSSDAKGVGQGLDVSKYSEANCSATINPDDYLDVSKKSESSALVLYQRDDSSANDEQIDVSKKSEMSPIIPYDNDNSSVDDAIVPFDYDDSSNKHLSEFDIESIYENDSQQSDLKRPNTPTASNDRANDETPVHMNGSPNAANLELQSPKRAEAKKTIPSILPDKKTSKLTDEQREKVLKILGQELKCTLAEYQTSFDISTSNDRIKQLDYLNTVALKIAEVAGIELRKSENEDGGVKSWSLSKADKARSLKDKKDRSKKKRSKKHFNVKKRKSRKEKEKSDVLSNTEKLFLDSIHSAKFSQL